MNRDYLSRTIANLEAEKKVHDQKFAGNAVHANCLPRFQQAIDKLKLELEKVAGDEPQAD